MGILVALPIATAMALLTKKKVEELIYPAITIIIMIIIFVGYFGPTLVGAVLAILFGIVSFFYSFIVIKKQKGLAKELILTPGFAAFILICLLMILYHNGRTIQDGDSCRVYGPQLLNMYLYSDLGGENIPAGSELQLLYTAPISAAWGYFCNILWFEYSDGVFAWARSVYSLSALLPAFTLVQRKEYIKFCSIIVIILQLFSNSYTDYANDGLLEAAVLYALIMVINLFCRSKEYNDKTYLFCTCCGAIVACMIKRAGVLSLFGTLFVLVFFTMDRIAFDKAHGLLQKIIPLCTVWISCLLYITYQLYKYIYGGVTITEVFVPILLLSAFIVSGSIIWIVRLLIIRKKYFKAFLIIGVFTIIGIGVAYGYIVYKDLTDEAEAQFYSFWSAWFLQKGIIDSSFVRFRFVPDALLACLCLFVLWIMKQMIHKRIINSFESEKNYEEIVTSVYTGLVVAIIMWCFLYLTRLGYIASFVRYMTPTVATIAWIVIYELLMIKNQNNKYIYAMVASILTLFTVYNPFKVIFDRPIGRSTYKEAYNNAGISLTPQDKVFFIEDRTSKTRVYYYASFPADCGKLSGEKFKKGVDENNDEGMTPQDLSNYLIEEQYNYVFLEKIGKDFSINYSSLFEEGESSVKEFAIYSIEPGEGSLVKLKLLGAANKTL